MPANSVVESVAFGGGIASALAVLQWVQASLLPIQDAAALIPTA